MSIDAKELNSCLWAEWKNGMKIMAESLLKDSVDISGSGCTIVLGNENFIQRAVMYLQRKSYIGKFKDYKSRISAYETTAMRSPDNCITGERSAEGAFGEAEIEAALESVFKTQVVWIPMGRV